MGLWSGIKHAINSTLGTAGFSPLDEIVKTRAAQTTVDTINDTKIGATNNTGGTATAGTAMAKLNKVITEVGATNNTGGTATAGTVMGKLNAILGYSLAPRVVKSVQRGTFATGAQDWQTVNITISPVDLAKSVLMISTVTSDPNRLTMGKARLTSTTNIYLFFYLAAAYADKVNVDWQVIEFY